MNAKNTIMAVGAAVLVVGWAVWSFRSGEGGKSDNAETLRSERRISDAKSSEKRAEARRRRETRIHEGRNGVKRQNEEKPELEVSEEDLEEMSELEKSVLASLRDALDNKDFSRVNRAIARLKQYGLELAKARGGHWSAYVHKSLKEAAVSALDWFGSDAMAELIEFMTDEDPDIAQTAIDKFELAMQDPTLADYQRADVIKMVAQVIDDADTLDWMFAEATNARHSVGVDTFISILQNGTAKAREMVPEYTEMFTGEENITTVKQLEKWLAENPDEPDDEDFYGPMTSD